MPGYDYQGNPIVGGSYDASGNYTGIGADGYLQGYAPTEVLQQSGYTPEQIAAYQAQPKAQIQNTGNYNLSGYSPEQLLNWTNGGAPVEAPSGFSMVGGGTTAPAPTSAPTATAAPTKIDWSSPQYQQSIRTVMADPNQTPANVSAAMKEWGVSNQELMTAMGWTQQQFDSYFAPVTGTTDASKGKGKGSGIAALIAASMLAQQTRMGQRQAPVMQRSQIGGDWRNQTTGYGTGRQRAGAGGIDYFNRTTYTPYAAGGAVAHFEEGGDTSKDAPNWLQQLLAQPVSGSGYDTRQWTDPETGLTYQTEQTNTGDGTYSTKYVVDDHTPYTSGKMIQSYDAEGKDTGKFLSAAPTDFDAEDFKSLALLAAIGAGGVGLQGMLGTGAGGVADASWADALGADTGGAADMSWADALGADSGATSLVPEAVTSPAGSVLSKAELDGTNIFGANSAPGALDVSALSAAAPGAASDVALTDIAKGLGYTGPATGALDFLKKIPGVGKIISGVTGTGEGGLGSLLPLLLLGGLLAGKGGGGGSNAGSNAKIPKLKANRTQTSYAQNYKPLYAAGGGIQALAQPQGGRYLQGPGDGVSDSIPATIEGGTPAALARNEFVVDARTVSELGNGSSEAGAEKLYKMMDRVHKARKSAGIGKDSRADRFLPA